MRILVKLLFIVFIFNSFSVPPASAQAELDKFKTEEEIQQENAALGWYEVALKYGKFYFNKAYDYCMGFFSEQVDGVNASIKEHTAVLDEAEKAVTERNVAADKRAKDLQEKTGLKGETTNMQNVIDNKELHYETKNFDDVNKEIKDN